jgi:hypothetical protein
MRRSVLAVVCAAAIAASGCSREQSDWEKARAANNTDSYELFIKKYPHGEFTPQAQARLKELDEEHDWQKARDTDTLEAYQGFLKQHPEGKWTEEARIRVENFSMPQAPNAAAAGPADWDESSSGGAGAPGGGPPTPTPTPTAPPASQPASQQAAAAPAAPPEAAPHRAATKGGGGYAIQLGAFKSGTAAANRRWASLQEHHPKLLAGLKRRVIPGTSASGKLFRLQVRGLTQAQARSICHALQADSQPCLVLPPHH